jgi:hypothetical protein
MTGNASASCLRTVIGLLTIWWLRVTVDLFPFFVLLNNSFLIKSITDLLFFLIVSGVSTNFYRTVLLEKKAILEIKYSSFECNNRIGFI